MKNLNKDDLVAELRRLYTALDALHAVASQYASQDYAIDERIKEAFLLYEEVIEPKEVILALVAEVREFEAPIPQARTQVAADLLEEAACLYEKAFRLEGTARSLLASARRTLRAGPPVTRG